MKTPNNHYFCRVKTKEGTIKVIIPALNEEQSIGKVIRDIPKNLAAEIVVVDNGSTDNTVQEAESHGATVLKENKRGYGMACLTGINYVLSREPIPAIIVFIDADYSDHPEEMGILVNPIIENGYDMVIGSRAMGNRESGSMTIPQIFGNWLATSLLRVFYRARFTDLGPFRAIKTSSLQKLGMTDQNFGWTVEMQLKAAKQKMKCTEIPVRYRRRIGKSKVSGTVKGTILAGYKILWTIFKYV
ncbi:MAG: glycosyltransferase family 2 protein [Cyclobacteriaceae bacterium]|nr:glycosyltransferase family 2 protein [Cyclobacteriaceae bacterium]